jgi:Na+-transporting methylmalonyl-CoA/oxaloacetate decarboxylase beta subunit
LKKKPVFSETSKTIQNEILEIVTAILNKEIEKEISNAPFLFFLIVKL